MTDNVYQALLANRIIFLGSEVRDENANAICAQMLLLNAEDPHKDIYLYINSPGGSVDSGMAIFDTMQWISNDVATVAMGLAASMGQFLLSAGTPGKRFALPHSRIMMHQPSGGLGGTASDIRIQAEQSLHIKRTMEQIEADSDRDRWFTAEQALEYGFIDHVYERASQITSEAPNQ
jgi:ATP-dependent Clp protease protease subunit